MRSDLKSSKIVLFFILAGASVLRLYHLGFESLWIDEIYAIRVSAKDLWTTITYQDVHPPLYYTIMHFWIKLFGTSEAALRSFSLICGLLGVWLIYLLGKNLFGRSAGLGAAFLMGFSIFHINYSQEARSYAMFALFSLASFYFMARLFQRGERKYFVRYFLATLLMLYTHNFAAWAVLFQNIFTAVVFIFAAKDQRFRFLAWIGCQLLALVVYMPWLLTCFINAGMVKDGFWIGRPDLSVIKDTLFNYAGGGKLLVVSVIAMLCVSSRWIHTKGRAAWGLIWSFSWLAITLAIPYIISLYWTPIYYIRYTIPSSLPYYLLVGFAVSQIRPDWLKKIFWLIIAVLLAISIVKFHGEVRKERWRDAAAYIDERSLPGDMAVFHLSGRQLFAYYSKKNDCEVVHFPPRSDEGIIHEQDKLVTGENIAMLTPIVSGRSRVWLIISHSRDKGSLLPGALQGMGYERIASAYFGPPGLDQERYTDSRQIFVTLFEKKITPE